MSGPRGRFFGTHFRSVVAGGFELNLSRATVPKEDLPEHRYDDAHFIFALDRGYLSRAFETGARGQGFDLIYNPPGTEHRDCFDEPGGRFLSVGVPRVVATAGSTPLHVKSPRAQALAARILGLCSSGAPVDAQVEDSLLDLAGCLAEPKGGTMRTPRWIDTADDLIRTRSVEQGVTVRALAHDLGLHPVYFARAYRAARGHGPAAALQRHRVQTATGLLMHDFSLADVAAMCGFADQSHLSRSVASEFGTPPSRLRSAFA